MARLGPQRGAPATGLRGHRVPLTALVTCVAVTSACRSPTQITVTLSTDAKCADVHGTSITVGHLGAVESAPPTATTLTCDNGTIGAIVVVPSGAKNDDLAIRVVMGFGAGADVDSCAAPNYGPTCVVARRALRFVPHQTLSLPIALHASCAGVLCGTNETCTSEGRCVSAEVPDPAACEAPGGCSEALLTPTPCVAGVSPLLVPNCGAWWGLWSIGQGNLSATGATEQLEGKVGRRFDVLRQIDGWDAPFPSDEEKAAAEGRYLHIEWQLQRFDRTPVTSTSFAAIAAGDEDATIDAEAAALKAYDKKLFLTFNGSFDDSLAPSMAPDNDAAFVTAWRRIHDRFTSAGVKNVVWVWMTRADKGGAKSFPAQYPGDAYTDWVGYVFNNDYTCASPADPWQSFLDLATPFDTWIDQGGLGPGAVAKPRFIASYKSTSDPNDPTRQADWLRGVADAFTALPKVKAYNYEDADDRSCSYRLDQSPGSVAAIANVGRASYVNQPH